MKLSTAVIITPALLLLYETVSSVRTSGIFIAAAVSDNDVLDPERLEHRTVVLKKQTKKRKERKTKSEEKRSKGQKTEL
jgi:hypothetical protein